jgi:hypothetical protein
LNHPVLIKLLDLLLPAADPVDDKDRSEFERFALPHTFKPRLSFGEAVIAVGATITRILASA